MYKRPSAQRHELQQQSPSLKWTKKSRRQKRSVEAYKECFEEKVFNYMSHKVHPKIFRIKETKDWVSRWVAKRTYAATLEEDFLIREFLHKKLKDAFLEVIEIERFAGRLTIIINSGRPGLIIGRGGAGIELLKKELAKMV